MLTWWPGVRFLREPAQFGSYFVVVRSMIKLIVMEKSELNAYTRPFLEHILLPKDTYLMFWSDSANFQSLFFSFTLESRGTQPFEAEGRDA